MSALKALHGRLGRFGTLLATLVTLVVVAPFVERTSGRLPVFSMLLTAILVAGVFSASGRRSVLITSVVLALPAFALEWGSNLRPTVPLAVLNLLSVGLFMGFLAVVILREVLREQEVGADTIAGGIAVYLMLGILGAFTFSGVEHLTPGSYAMAGQALQSLREGFEFVFPELVYFSFVTVTTLGYGDVVPTNPPARMLATVFAVAGQLYVAIFISRLVGLHLAAGQRAGGREDG